VDYSAIDYRDLRALRGVDCNVAQAYSSLSVAFFVCIAFIGMQQGHHSDELALEAGPL
jgi:hypothetical protein